jgi:hypothetical protein
LCHQSQVGLLEWKIYLSEKRSLVQIIINKLLGQFKQQGFDTIPKEYRYISIYLSHKNWEDLSRSNLELCIYYIYLYSISLGIVSKPFDLNLN